MSMFATEDFTRSPSKVKRFAIRVLIAVSRTALLSQEGSVIAFFAMTRGVVPKRNVSVCILKECGFGTTPRTMETAVSIVLPS